MKNGLLNYLSKGIQLTNKSIDILLIGVVISLFTMFPSFYTDLTVNSLLLIISLILVFLQIGYFMTTPIFLVEKQHEKILTIQHLWTITLQSTKRLILPIILFIFFVIILTFVIASIIVVNGTNSIERYINSLQGLNPIAFILTSIFSFFIFTSIYFSIEKKGVFGSMKNSIIFSFENIKFIILVIVINSLTYIILGNIPTKNEFVLVLSTILEMYISFIVTATALVFYQSKK